MIKQNIKAGIIQGLTILFVLALGGVSYAAFTGFTALQATPTETLTASKWNDMVDAVKDEYSTTETLTNKTWLGKPVYRKVFTQNLGANANDIVILTGLTGIDKAWVEDFYLYNVNSGYSVSESASFYYGIDAVETRAMVKQNGSQIDFTVVDGNPDWANNGDVYVVLEYTKTTD